MEVGLEHHDLRLTWATLALQAGIHPKVVRETSATARSRSPLDIYSHVTPLSSVGRGCRRGRDLRFVAAPSPLRS